MAPKIDQHTINALAEDALQEAIGRIQVKLGSLLDRQIPGDVASHVFSDGKVQAELAAYIAIEIGARPSATPVKPSVPAHVYAKLEELGRDWFTSLGTTQNDGEWRLTIIPRKGGWMSHTYTGTLSSVVARAHAGEPPDERSQG